MLLHAEIVPPRRVLDAVAEAVRNAGVEVVRDQPTSRSRLFGRRSTAGNAEADPRCTVAGPGAELELIDTRTMALPVAAFGNVTSGDSARVAAAVRSAAAHSPGAVVRIAGGTALEFPGDRNVWARLEGDLDALRSMARQVTEVVEQHGFFVDRRMFRPLLCVAVVTDRTTASRLNSTVDALEAFVGEPWEVDHVWLMRAFYGSATTASTEVDRFPLAPPDRTTQLATA